MWQVIRTVFKRLAKRAIIAVVTRLEGRRSAGVNDPAPSLLLYRLERLWLTPAFRSVLRTGVPVFVIVCLGTWYITDLQRFERIRDGLVSFRQSIEERPEFMVTLMAVDGATPELAQDIEEVLSITLPVSQFALDLKRIKSTLESLDPVRHADVRIKSGGLLAIRIEERAPAVIFQGPDGFELLAKDGHRVAALDATGAVPNLPLIAGQGANLHVEEALRLIAASEPIKPQIIGLVRVGERRWDVQLTNERRIMLPTRDPGLALDRAIALHMAQDVLSRDIVSLDYRNSARPTVRMSEVARKEWRRIKNLELLSSESSQ